MIHGTKMHSYLDAINPSYPENGVRWEAVIRVRDAEFEVHKSVLCQCSPFFRALFTEWSVPEKNYFEITGLSPCMMQLIIEFAYTGALPLTNDNAAELLQAAVRLSVQHIVEECCKLLEGLLCMENCIGIWKLANMCCCPELEHKALGFILYNFEQIIFSEEFHQLSAQDLCAILNCDYLNMEECLLFEAIFKWMERSG